MAEFSCPNAPVQNVRAVAREHDSHRPSAFIQRPGMSGCPPKLQKGHRDFESAEKSAVAVLPQIRITAPGSHTLKSWKACHLAKASTVFPLGHWRFRFDILGQVVLTLLLRSPAGRTRIKYRCRSISVLPALLWGEFDDSLTILAKGYRSFVQHAMFAAQSRSGLPANGVRVACAE